MDTVLRTAQRKDIKEDACKHESAKTRLHLGQTGEAFVHPLQSVCKCGNEMVSSLPKRGVLEGAQQLTALIDKEMPLLSQLLT